MKKKSFRGFFLLLLFLPLLLCSCFSPSAVKRKCGYFAQSIMLFFSSLAIAALVGRGLAHADGEQKPVAGPHKSLWYNALPGDGGTQVSWVELRERWNGG